MKILNLDLTPKNFERFLRARSEIRRTHPDQGSNLGLLPETSELKLIAMPYPGKKHVLIIEDDHGTALARLFLVKSAARPEILMWSLFESVLENEIAQKIFATARDIAKAEACTKLVGPMTYNTWFPYRYRTDKMPMTFSWEPSQPRGYIDLIRACDLTCLESYTSKGYDDLENLVRATEGSFQNFDTSRLAIEPLTTDDHLIRDLYELSLLGFRNNYLYEPITFEAFMALYVPIFKKSDLRFSRTIRNRSDGVIQGFFYMYPDQDYLILKTVTINDSCRGMGASNAMLHSGSAAALHAGLGKVVTALVKVGAQSESYGKKMNLNWTHTYELFEVPG